MIAPVFPQTSDAPPFQVELMIFDLDGTLIDTSHDLMNAVNFALQQCGKDPLSLERVIGYVGDGARKLLERALARPSEAELQTALQHFRAHYAAHLADFSRLYPGMIDVLAHFRAKKKAVLTNKPHEITLALLQRLNLSLQFEVIQGGQTHLPLKPDPTSLQNLLVHLQIEAPRAVIIGDGENDMLAGKAAGVKTCAATYGFRSGKDLLALQPDFVIHAPIELTTLFA